MESIKQMFSSAPNCTKSVPPPGTCKSCHQHVCLAEEKDPDSFALIKSVPSFEVPSTRATPTTNELNFLLKPFWLGDWLSDLGDSLLSVGTYRMGSSRLRWSTKRRWPKNTESGESESFSFALRGLSKTKSTLLYFSEIQLWIFRPASLPRNHKEIYNWKRRRPGI